jgi:3',5'-cyclic AMP phosphodiesterase CpdA
MKFVHAGDLHVWRHGIPLSDPFAVKRWLGAVNLLVRRAAHFPPELRTPALDAIEAEQPDVVIFTGDFSQSSRPAEFRECRDRFAALHQALGERLIAIPGNHDVYTQRSLRKKWLETGLPWVRTEAVTRSDLTEKLTVVTVNHSRPFRLRSNGEVNPDTENQLRKVLADCRQDSRTVVLAGHYPYTTPPGHPESPHHQLLGEEKLAGVVREFSPALYLHGHKHVRWALRSEHTPETLCLNCGSLGMQHGDSDKQAGYLSWDLQEDGTLSHLTAHLIDLKGHQRRMPLNVT